MNILLDVDGVLIRDDKILKRVRDNIAHYVRSKVPRAKDPERLRDHLYTRYGHTGRGMTQALGVPTPDFNAYIYDRTLLEQLAEYLTTQKFQKDAHIIRNLLHEGNDIRLFSNAPMLWTIPVANAIDSRIGVESMVGLKPQTVTYSSVRTYHRPTIIVDDVMTNLRPIVHVPNWIPVYYSLVVDDWTIPTITTLDELPYIVEKLKKMNVK